MGCSQTSLCIGVETTGDRGLGVSLLSGETYTLWDSLCLRKAGFDCSGYGDKGGVSTWQQHTHQKIHQTKSKCAQVSLRLLGTSTHSSQGLELLHERLQFWKIDFFVKVSWVTTWLLSWAMWWWRVWGQNLVSVTCIQQEFRHPNEE